MVLLLAGIAGLGDPIESNTLTSYER